MTCRGEGRTLRALDLGTVYSLQWRRSSILALRPLTKALFATLFLGKFLNWFRMIWPCTTTKRSTASACMAVNARASWLVQQKCFAWRHFNLVQTLCARE